MGISIQTADQVHNEVIESSVVYILLITIVVFIAVLSVVREKVKTVDGVSEGEERNVMLTKDNKRVSEEEKEEYFIFYTSQYE